MLMDMVTTWPVLVASIVGSAGVAGAWWYGRHHQMAPERPGRGDSPRSKARQEGKARFGRKSMHGPDNLDTLADWEPVATRVLTSGERDAYHVLRRALPDHVILAQVPVARFIKVPTKNSYSEWLRRVGSLCADLVVCDMSSQVIAVVEIRQPLSREKERTQRRHARMDRVLQAARIPVHVWLEGALPGPAVARESILGAAITTSGKSGYNDVNVARRDAEAAAVVASMQSPTGAMNGMSVNEAAVDVSLDDWAYADDEDGADCERKEPPPSTWFDDLDSGPMPLDQPAVVATVKPAAPARTRAH